MKSAKDRLEEDVIYFRKRLAATECPMDKMIFEAQLNIMEYALATFIENQGIKEQDEQN